MGSFLKGVQPKGSTLVIWSFSLHHTYMLRTDHGKRQQPLYMITAMRLSGKVQQTNPDDIYCASGDSAQELLGNWGTRWLPVMTPFQLHWCQGKVIFHDFATCIWSWEWQWGTWYDKQWAFAPGSLVSDLSSFFPPQRTTETLLGISFWVFILSSDHSVLSLSWLPNPWSTP